MIDKASFDILAQIKQLVPNAGSTKKIQTRNIKRDTQDQARQKVIDKLLLNKAYFGDTTLERPDSVYKQQADGNYAIGIKYGNRYLESIANGRPFVDNIPAANVPEVLDMLADAVASKKYDDEIAKIMQANLTVRNNARH